MSSLSISDSAYALIQLEIERSGIDDAAINLIDSRPSCPLPDEVLRLPAESRDKALEEYRAALRAVPHELRACAVQRSGVPAESLFEVRGVCFSFSPEWQARMHG